MQTFTSQFRKIQEYTTPNLKRINEKHKLIRKLHSL
jgi:hypothetical protein